MKKPVIIGIAGGSASGKTSIAQELYDCFKGRHTIRIIKIRMTIIKIKQHLYKWIKSLN